MCGIAIGRGQTGKHQPASWTSPEPYLLTLPQVDAEWTMRIDPASALPQKFYLRIACDALRSRSTLRGGTSLPPQAVGSNAPR